MMAVNLVELHCLERNTISRDIMNGMEMIGFSIAIIRSPITLSKAGASQLRTI